MGIKQLMKLIEEEAASAVKEVEMSSLTGRKVAIDASMALYQFLVAVRQSPGGGSGGSQLVNDAGEVTSHVQGMFNRTIKMMTSGVKVCYVFDGKPPQMKGGELAKRAAARDKAEAGLKAAEEENNEDDVEKFSRRLVKVTKQHNEDCKELLTLMGVPYYTAPCEAEAQCAELAKNNKVYATATEDMDALTFRTPKLLRKMTGSQGANKVPILEIDVEMVLLGLKLTYDEFVDLCILCGCDYCNTIVGIGPKTALSLIREHKSIENVLKALEANPTKKGNIPPEWYARKEAFPKEKKEGEKKEGEKKEGDVEGEEKKEEEEEEEMEYVDVPACYVQARVLFLRAEVTPAAEVELNWKPPQEEALKKFLCERMGFAEDRVKSAIQRLMAAQEKKQQMRMDSFFKTTETVESKKRKAEAANLKAKAVAKAAKDAKKKGKAGGMGVRR